MRLYAGSSSQFVTDTIHSQIADKLSNAFMENFRYQPSPAEKRSWRESLLRVSNVVQESNLMDHGILLELQLPLTSRRLDCMITGHDQAGDQNAVIIELKQWDKCEPSEGDNEVVTRIGGALRDHLHPAAQVRQYALYLQDGHEAFYETNPIQLSACSYLHNYHFAARDPVLDDKFSGLIEHYPVFCADDFDRISGYLKERLDQGNGMEVLRRVEQGKYRPSKKLMDHVAKVINEQPQFVLLDEQLVVFDKVLATARAGFHDKDKAVIIIKGGPGTGKSVIAIQLMAELLRKGYNAHYATGSRAFTTTLREIVGTRGAVQFKYFNSYAQAQANEVDVLICDEAHRIRATSNNRFMKKEDRSDVPQIIELLKASQVAVFFIDDDQVVRPAEVGSTAYIRQHAEERGCRVHEYELEAQFRCSGSDAFVNWVNNTLGIRPTANVLWNGAEGFDFKIFDSPQELENAIRDEATAGYSARMAAGFCWPWSKRTNPDGTLNEDVIIGDYKRPWNARPEATRLAKGIPKANLWAYDQGGLDQVGCIYTAQGFEFDYAGVIFGNDLKYDPDKAEWAGVKENNADSVVKRSKGKFVDLVKNTYRVLLSRGMKGCYVYFMDKETERFFRSRMNNVAAFKQDETPQVAIEKLEPYVNALPLLPLRAVANPAFENLEGLFADSNNVEWVPVEDGPYPEDRFLVRIEGDSMEPKIPDGSLALFRRDPGGSRNGKIVLCRVDSLTGGGPVAVVKKYRSFREMSDDGIGEAELIVLSSLNPAYEDIRLKEGDGLEVLGVFEYIMDSEDCLLRC